MAVKYSRFITRQITPGTWTCRQKEYAINKRLRWSWDPSQGQVQKADRRQG